MEASAPAAPAAPAAAHQSQDQQKDHGSNEGIQNKGDNSRPEVNTKSRQQPIADECADQPDQQITDQSKAATLHYPACQPTGYNADNDDNEETLIGEVHDVAFQ
jgi:hypothetical protein